MKEYVGIGHTLAAVVVVLERRAEVEHDGVGRVPPRRRGRRRRTTGGAAGQDSGGPVPLVQGGAFNLVGDARDRDVLLVVPAGVQRHDVAHGDVGFRARFHFDLGKEYQTLLRCDPKKTKRRNTLTRAMSKLVHVCQNSQKTRPTFYEKTITFAADLQPSGPILRLRYDSLTKHACSRRRCWRCRRCRRCWRC